MIFNLKLYILGQIILRSYGRIVDLVNLIVQWKIGHKYLVFEASSVHFKIHLILYLSVDVKIWSVLRKSALEKVALRKGAIKNHNKPSMTLQFS